MARILKIRGKDGTWLEVPALKGSPGVSWVPSVSESGVLSWTNDGGLENPSPVELKGVSGVWSGATTPPEGYTVWIDPSGDPTSVLKGATFTPSVDDLGNLSWTNDQGLVNPETKNIKGPKGEPGKDAVIDATLTQEGEAADAKATGDAVQEIADSVFGTLKETEIDALTLISSTKTENGYITLGRINNGIYTGDHNNTLYCFFLNNGGKFKAENLSSDSYGNPTRCWCAFSGVNGTTDELLAEYSDKVQTSGRTGVSTGGYIAFPDDVKMVVFAHTNSDKSTISIKKLENQRDSGIKTSVENALNDIAQLKVDVKSNASVFGGRLSNENTYKTGIAEAAVASTTSSITDGVIVPALKNDVANAEISEIFRYSVPMKIAGDTFPKYKAVTSGLPINLGYRIEFYFSGKEFEVMIHGSSALTVCVDDYSITSSCLKMPIDGNVYYQKVTFPSETEHKHISIYIDGIFRGIKTNGVIEKYNANRLKIIADGDSITESTAIIGGGEAVINSWISKLAKVFNYDLLDVAFGGTGYINNGTGRINMVDRFEDNVAKYNPDILISMGGLNDSYSDLSALETAVNSYWDKVSKLGCKAICVTPFNPQPTVMQISDAFLPILQKTCAKYGIPLIDTARGITYDSIGSIITDNTNGYIKGIINSDNHDAFIGTDNTHLTLKGHEYFAKRMESEVYKLIRIDKYFN